MFKSSTTRLPRSHPFQEVYNATLTRLLAPGNVGSCIDDAGTSKILGQVVTASLKICVAMTIPACEFFDDLRRAPNVSLTPQPTSRRVSRSRKFKGTADWCEPETLRCTLPFSHKSDGMVRARLWHKSPEYLGNAANGGRYLLILGSQVSTRLVD